MPRTPSQTTVVPLELSQSLSSFRSEYPDPLKVSFLMMRFQDTPAHKGVVAAVRNTLADYGMKALRADDRQYHSDLYWNIMTYIYGCGSGISVFERVEEESFNPNVAFEVGYMLALGKPVCLLKERTLKALHTDLAGKLYRTFDAFDPQNSVPAPLEKWLSDQEALAKTYSVLSDLFAGNEVQDKECRRILVMLSPGRTMNWREIRVSLGFSGGDSDCPTHKRLMRLRDLSLIEQIESGTDAGRYRVRSEVVPLVRKFVEKLIKW